MTDREDAFKKFQENYEPKDDLAKQAKKDEKKFDVAQVGAVRDLTKQIVSIQNLTSELRAIRHGISEDRTAIEAWVARLIESNKEMQAWWDGKTEEIRQMMLMMAAMGFKLELGGDDEDSKED